GFTPRCRAKYLSSYRSVASISSGEISRNAVQTRNFWSYVRVTRSNLPSRSRTHCENETPSSNGGFGSNNQTKPAVIPSRTRDLAHGALITRDNLRDLPAVERSLSSFGMRRVFICRNVSAYCVTMIFLPTPNPLMLCSYISSSN